MAFLKKWGGIFLYLLFPTLGWSQITYPTLPVGPARMAPGLPGPTAAQKLSYRVLVRDPAAFQRWLRDNMPGISANPDAGQTTIFAIHHLDTRRLNQLRHAPGVLFVDQPNRRASPELLLEHTDLRANQVEPLHRLLPQTNGQGLTVSVKEQPFDTTDIDLRGRILKNAVFGQPAARHATTMATLIGGAGNTGPGGRGVAPGVRLTAADFANLLPDDGAALAAAGVTVQNHSYGVDAIENYYGLEALAYDTQTRQYPGLLHVFSSGNAGNGTSSTGPYSGLPKWANLTGQFKMSKNTLSVGATDTSGQVSARSSRGPAYDGRLKPELVAFGDGGSSEAAAVVSGLALLVQQAYRDAHGGSIPPAALVKAALINSAQDLGRAGVDFESGFGAANGWGAVQSMLQRHFYQGQVSTGQQQVFTLAVPAGSRQVKVTLTWTDPAAAADAPRALVNDLDLVVGNTATGQVWEPWVLSSYPHADSLQQLPKRRADRLNNVEQVTLTLPEAGNYELRVTGFQVPQGPQDFSLVYEAVPGLTWSYPVAGSQVFPGQRNRLRWLDPLPQTTARLEYRLGESGPWILVANQVSLASGFFDWTPPATAGPAQLRLSTPDQVLTSATFLIAPKLTMQVGYNCVENFMLYWSGLRHAAGYQIYHLQGAYLEPLIQTTDTVLFLNKSVGTALYYAVAPVFPGLTGMRSNTVSYAQNGSSCYVQSFLPRLVVTDTVVFDAGISSNSGLKTINLQRLEKDRFITIQTISPVKNLTFVFEDPRPHPGRNDYRLQLLTQDGREIYSQEEFIFFTPAGSLLVYPNPQRAGEPVNVVLPDDTAELELFDSLGRRVGRVEETGAIKTLETTGLKPGVYLLKTQTAAGRPVFGRLVVL